MKQGMRLDGGLFSKSCESTQLCHAIGGIPVYLYNCSMPGGALPYSRLFSHCAMMFDKPQLVLNHLRCRLRTLLADFIGGLHLPW